MAGCTHNWILENLADMSLQYSSHRFNLCPIRLLSAMVIANNELKSKLKASSYPRSQWIKFRIPDCGKNDFWRFDAKYHRIKNDVKRCSILDEKLTNNDRCPPLHFPTLSAKAICEINSSLSSWNCNGLTVCLYASTMLYSWEWRRDDVFHSFLMNVWHSSSNVLKYI